MSAEATESAVSKHDPYGALRVRDFRVFLTGHLLSVLGVQMQTMAVGWQLYEKTGSALSLGNVGLIQFIPMLGLALPAGQIADRFDRRKILMAATVLSVVAAIGLTAVSSLDARVSLIYFFLFLSGLARAFQGPARSAMMPNLVPQSSFANAVSWAVSGFELSSMIGPFFAGTLVAVFKSATPVYVLGGLGSVVYIASLAAITSRSYAAAARYSEPGAKRSFTATLSSPVSKPVSGTSLQTLVAGLSYVWRNRLLFAAMSLDLFAVLFGGAVALLPIYAKDILRVGPFGLGWLQAATPLGAVLMATLMAHLPPLKRAGKSLIWAVAGFGVATIVFGVSRNFWLSLAMLFMVGAFDNISVVVRHTLVQLLTPDEMRGRVSAVNGMFINASNELGRFESGAVAALFGTVFSVVSGGVGTLIVVAVIALSSPQLRGYGSLNNGHKH